ncbi:competence protein ComEC [Rhodococcus sp. 27YEA15]|uniref:ComEC/Rec2 family competence protein n=1 Tax=Rhodococcus sp. 27YEA15 TaxID=3156259 RepID=UPI003C7BAB11
MSEDSERTVLDARVLPAALAAWAATVSAVLFGTAAAWILAATLAASAMVVLLVFRGSWSRIVLVALVFGIGFSVVGAWRTAETVDHPLRIAAKETAWATVEVAPVEDPHAVGGANPGHMVFRATLRSATIGGQTVSGGGQVTVRGPGWAFADLLPGQSVTVRGKVGLPWRNDLTLAVITSEGEPVKVGDPPWYQRWAAAVRDRFAAVCAAALPERQAGLLPGLVVGDTSGLSPQVKENFKVAGLTHLTAVSGANISILLGAVLLVVRAAALSPKVGAVLALTALAAFVIIARPSPSVLRASVMGAIGLLSLVTGRRKQALPALAVAVVGLITVMPELAVDWGFALSVAATGALVLIAPVWVGGLCRWGWPRWLAEIVAVSCAAFVVTVPLMAAMTGTFSVVTVAANMAVAPVIGVITVIGALVALCAVFSTTAATAVAFAVRAPMWWLLEVSERSAAVPGATVSVPSGATGAAVTAGVVLAAVALLRFRIARRAVAGIVACAILTFLVHHVFGRDRIPSGWALVMCDVGQGDGVVLAAGDGRVVVVDAGPDPASMDRCLGRLGVRDIALVVISHFHADHIAGLAAVLHGRSVGAVGVGPMLLPENGFNEVMAAAQAYGVPVLGLEAGNRFSFGTVQLDVLGPLLPVPRLPGSGEARANDQSVVMMARTPAGRILLTGDSETAGEEAILRSGIDVRADVLKLPHHGSRTTSTAFLRAVNPRLTLISCGRGNTFGHPHPEILEDLTTLGSAVSRTDLDGTVAVYGQAGGSVSVVSTGRGNVFG